MAEPNVNDPDPGRKRSGRSQLLLVALVFLLPLAAAVFLYYGGGELRPAGRSNHGTLLSPIVNLSEQIPESALVKVVEDRWALVYAHDGPCATRCRDALYTLRQSRLMLGNEMNRVLRVFLRGPDAPDTLFLETEHRGMIVLHDPATRSIFDSARPEDNETGGYYLLDPLGNLVMYFPPGVEPRDMVDDLAHLLELSRIG